MSVIASVGFLLLALPLLGSLYLLLLTLLSGQPRPQPPSRRHLRFDIVVPAHDEAGGIARTIASLQAIDWPRDRFRILVVADNCTDATATIARDAGAQVLERHDARLRGKGHALAFAFAASRRDGLADAVAVVDADTGVSPNLLEAFATRLEQGARAVQAHYGVRNPLASWRTRLMTIAKGAFHIVRSRGRERMGLSCGLRGNGWCVTHGLLHQVPYRAYSLTEDLEYSIHLGLAGVRVHYADEAHADGDMEAGGATAAPQRQRWEQGRFALTRQHALPLLYAGLRRPSSLCLDLALDLLVPPLSSLALSAVALLALAAAAAAWQPALGFWLMWPAVSLLAIALYVLRGWQLSGTGSRGLLDLAAAPGFVLWKLLAMLRPRTAGWVRTQRRP
ncbi:glycosyltransferase family 2 protein [Luteimonas terrae]|uniref:Cellulose synthase/poly-beta-1,6-N-acetylglucosamine synthase-like glycosyltransferase n=1 Tax=Luteimonas terrae TaxID=1530191 RepID=A0ABU1XY89_9GAMM|nr:glycosyltransferase family 2 protein [Luteimonas terrae]MDR7193727.1 cellulose synthase/poly-beta-1,6-N-acetylglucosamine synthase-like glycosyltransferase [Luteimonas terrae]